jgi:predicted nucleic acid-binding protein
MRLLDTDVLIDIQRGHPPAVAWFGSLTELPSVPGLVVMELIQDANNTRQVQEARRLVAPLPVVWPTEADCQHALAEFTNFHLSHRLGLLDALIATCTLALGAILCTYNVRHFRLIHGLTTEQPYAR